MDLCDNRTDALSLIFPPTVQDLLSWGFRIWGVLPVLSGSPRTLCFLRARERLILSHKKGSSSVFAFFLLSTSLFARPRVAKVSLLCQAASLMVTVKTEQFKREIAARKKGAGGGKDKAKRGAKEKDAPKQE